MSGEYSLLRNTLLRCLEFGEIPFATVFTVLIFFIDELVLHLGFVRPLVVFVFLTFVPGHLLYVVAFEEMAPETWLPLVVPLSIIANIFSALLLNGSVVLGMEGPLTAWTFILFQSGLVLSLATVFGFPRYRGPVPRFRRSTVLGVTLVALSVGGATYLNKTASATILFAYWGAVMLVSAMVIYSRRVSFSPEFLYLFALSVLFQNSLVDTYLATGDGRTEYLIANLVLQSNYWNPTYPLPKNGMLRISLLHPVYSMGMDVPLMLEFKVVHPAIVATIPVSVYVLSKAVISDREALTATLLYCSFFGFYTLLARNTRDSVALLFGITVILVAVNSSDIKESVVQPILLFLLVGVVLSHYGIAILFVFIYISGFIVLKIIGREMGVRKLNTIRLGSLLVYVTVLYGWYSHVTSGRLFYILVNVLMNTLLPIFRGRFNGSVGTMVLSETNVEPILQVIRIQYGLLLVFIFIGILVLAYDILGDMRAGALDASERVRVRFLAYSGAFGIPLLLAFSPLPIFGINRFWMSSLVLLVSIAVIGMRLVGRRICRCDASQFRAVLAVIVALSVVLNSGVLATVVDGRTTQPNLVREEIIGENDPAEMFQLFTAFTTAEDMSATGWISYHKPAEAPVYGSGPKYMYPSQFFTEEFDPRKPPGNYRPMSTEMSAGYVFVPTYVTLGNRVVPYLTSPGPGITSPSDFPKLSHYNVSEHARVYDSGKSSAYRVSKQSR